MVILGITSVIVFVYLVYVNRRYLAVDRFDKES